MKAFSIFRRPERTRKTRNRNRTFRPTIDGLESRQLLTLSLVGQAPSFHITSPPLYPSHMISLSDNLGIVSVGANQRLTETINYGDGSPTEDGWFGANPTIKGSVNTAGQHDYMWAGSYNITISLTDASGNNLTWTDSVTVDPTAAPVKPPTVTLTLTENTPVGLFPDVVGAPFSDTVRLTSSDNSARLVAVTWSFQSPDGRGVIDPSQTPGGKFLDQDGFHEVYVQQVNKAAMGVNTLTLDSYDWGARPGTYTITASASWVDSSGAHSASRSISDTVVAPISSYTFNPIATPNVYPTPNGHALAVSADYNVTVSGAYGGSFGVIQTVQTDQTNKTLEPNIKTGKFDLPATWGTIKKPFGSLLTVLDGTPIDVNGNPYRTDQNIPEGMTPRLILGKTVIAPTVSPYYAPFDAKGQPTSPTVPAGSTLHLEDEPKVYLVLPGDKSLQGRTVEIDRYDTFTDIIVFTPNGGVPVPLTKGFQWSWGASVIVTPTQFLTAPSFGPTVKSVSIGISPTWDMTSSQLLEYGMIRLS